MSTRKATSRIILHRRDHERLTQLTTRWLSIRPELADALLLKLGRAKLADQSDCTVQIGSTLVYDSEGGPRRKVTLVYPEQADISIGAVSVLTPVGAALLGLTTGDRVEVQGNDGRMRWLAVVEVARREGAVDLEAP
ncbi:MULTISPECIES: GreA/GreB family elongation factor [Hyphomicrobiales]|uniref:GreA/GreB family elongation factor n=1 Tax=Methylobacterium sp. CCH7-A2 TaxID=1768789 RepID=UPI0009E716EC|nr:MULTISPECIES: GreA/GreB family elongation factor [Hyphomicrobiales]